jgi:glycosyltransferase involved in cell wall biosynthesis
MKGNTRYSPIFSIIIPTHNREAMLLRAIHSVFKQSYQNFEVIIINDGSKENYTKAYNNILDSYPNYKIKIIL